MSRSLHLYLSFNPGTYTAMAASNASSATVEPNEPAIPREDARGIIEAIRRSRRANECNLPAKTQPLRTKAVREAATVTGGANITSKASGASSSPHLWEVECQSDDRSKVTRDTGSKSSSSYKVPATGHNAMYFHNSSLGSSSQSSQLNP